MRRESPITLITALSVSACPTSVSDSVYQSRCAPSQYTASQCYLLRMKAAWRRAAPFFDFDDGGPSTQTPDRTRQVDLEH